MKQIVDNHVFIIDQLTGILQTNETYARFADGYFEISVKAMNAPDKNDRMAIKVWNKFQIFILFTLKFQSILFTGGYAEN